MAALMMTPLLRLRLLQLVMQVEPPLLLLLQQRVLVGTAAPQLVLPQRELLLRLRLFLLTAARAAP